MEPSLRDPLQGGAECFGLLNHTLDMRDQQQSNREPLSTDGSDTQSHLQLPTSAKPAKRMQDGPWEVVVQMAVFFILAIALMGGHLGFFIWLDGQAVELSGISQSAQSAVANFFAVAVELVILGGIGVAYNQFLWRLFRLKSLKAKTIDTLVTLVMSPWDLWRPDLYNDATFAALIGILCALVPIAVVFPPGALSVEYQEGVIPVTLTNVPTMNISDFGRGGMKDVHERSFLQLEGSMNIRSQYLI
ncbi:unnamed protein product [Clonostachys byssicola]|uniref:Uncharacterized protein n=1 Tax=Clonostachys byssicola TaxID=160290 RepID=A0A9N9Y2U7_9HYPO|nr:unnamed protein product [Clonostachys byssicola]